jgi:hypothetical protein
MTLRSPVFSSKAGNIPGFITTETFPAPKLFATGVKSGVLRSGRRLQTRRYIGLKRRADSRRC